MLFSNQFSMTPGWGEQLELRGVIVNFYSKRRSLSFLSFYSSSNQYQYDLQSKCSTLFLYKEFLAGFICRQTYCNINLRNADNIIASASSSIMMERVGSSSQ
eukprot:916934_1